MKRFIAISLGITAIFSVYQNFRYAEILKIEDQKIESLREQINLIGQSSEASIPTENTVTAADVATMKLYESIHKNPSPESRELLNKNLTELKNRMQAFTVNDVDKYMSSTATYNGLNKGTKMKLMQMAASYIHIKYPKETCDLMIQHKQYLTDENFTTIGFIESNIREMCAKNQQDALQWLRDNYKEHKQVIGQTCAIEVIKSIAVNDRKLAFILVEEFQIYPLLNVTQSIMSAAKSDEEKIAAVKDLRTFMSTVKDPREKAEGTSYAIASIGRTKAMEGYDKAIAWANKAELTTQEWRYYAGDLGNMILNGDQGKWLTLLHEHAQEWNFRDSSVRGIMFAWCASDQKAAAAWLESAPDGFVKNHAIYCFSTTIAAEQLPEAVKFASMIKNDEFRQATLHKMYHELPTNTPEKKAAADAFEAEFNIKHSTSCDP